MTFERDKYIKIPLWLVTFLIPGLVALITTISVLSSTKATLETKATRNELEIKELKEIKVDRNEFTIFMNSLNRIENKIDKHAAGDKD